MGVVSRNVILLLVLAAIASLVVMGFGFTRLTRPVGPTLSGEEGPSNAINVVLIVLDALRADYVAGECNGVPVMPKLSRLAEESVRFTNAVTPCTWTRPAMASIFTSLHVDAHQVYFSNDPRSSKKAIADALPGSSETLASYLGKLKYTTVGVQTNANLVSDLGFAQGFDSYYYMSTVPANEVTTLAIEKIRRAYEPFFLYVHYMDPHMPYDPPARYRKLFGWPPGIDAAELHIVTNFKRYFWDLCDRVTGNKEKSDFEELSPKAKEALQRLYAGECRFLDDELARLLDHFRNEKDNTLIIIVADHGEHFWEHGYLGHGLTMYEEELRVPFFMLGAGLKPRAIDVPVEMLDILPTVAGLVGGPSRPTWQGMRLFDGIRQGGDTPVFSYTRGPYPACNTDLEMVRRGDLKLIVNRKHNRVELYDLAADPRERTDLAAERPEDVAKMKAMLDAHREQNIKDRQQDAPEQVEISDELRDQFKALGYGK